MDNYLKPEASVSYTDKVLEAMEFHARTVLSRHMLASAVNAEAYIDQACNQLVLQLRARIFSDPERAHKAVHKITVDQAHPDWRHHLLASQPQDTFRRRWLAHFWGLDPEYKNTRVTHSVEVHVPALFPENRYEYPESLGRPHFPILINHLGQEPAHG